MQPPLAIVELTLHSAVELLKTTHSSASNRSARSRGESCGARTDHRHSHLRTQAGCFAQRFNQVEGAHLLRIQGEVFCEATEDIDPSVVFWDLKLCQEFSRVHRILLFQPADSTTSDKHDFPIGWKHV